MIARMQIRETSWDSLKSEWADCVAQQICGLPSDIQSLFSGGQITEIEAKNPVDFIALSVIGQKSEIDTLYSYFDTADRQPNQPHRWSIDGKVDFETEYTGQQDDILATQPDHVTYDENGNETSRTPSSFESPNWAQQWLGQGENEFAREYSREYSEEFG